jgi:hypothetical protein
MATGMNRAPIPLDHDTSSGSQISLLNWTPEMALDIPLQ